MYSSKPIFQGGLERNKKYKICLGKATLVVYGHSPLRINVTGLRSMYEIKSTRKYIENLYGLICSDAKVDNIFYSHKDSHRLFLELTLNLKPRQQRARKSIRYETLLIQNYFMIYFPLLYSFRRLSSISLFVFS